MLLKKSSHHRQKGSALVMAVFIIVVVLSLATALINMLSSSSNTIAYQVIGIRAFAAANAGMEMRLKELFPLNASALRCDSAQLPGDTFNTVNYVTINNITGLNNCAVSVTCNDFEDESVIYYRLESTSRCNMDYDNMGAENYTSRNIAVEARSL